MSGSRTQFFRSIINNDTRDTLVCLNDGVQPDVRDPIYGFTALHIAASLGFLSTLQLLIDKKADVNIATTKELDSVKAVFEWKGVIGSTALHVAVQKSNKKCVKILLSAGADRTVVDASGKRPRDYARIDDIARMLDNTVSPEGLDSKGMAEAHLRLEVLKTVMQQMNEYSTGLVKLTTCDVQAAEMRLDVPRPKSGSTISQVLTDDFHHLRLIRNQLLDSLLPKQGLDASKPVEEEIRVTRRVQQQQHQNHVPVISARDAAWYEEEERKLLLANEDL